MLYRIRDDVEMKRLYGNLLDRIEGNKGFVRIGLPSTVRVNGGKGYVMLTPEWMEYVRKINDTEANRKYTFKDWKTKCSILKDAVGWHNTGKGNRVEQVTFSGNIVDVWKVEGYRAYVLHYDLDIKPPSTIHLPKSNSLHPIVHLLSTQYADKLDITTNLRYPRMFLIANPGESLWIDIRNLEKIDDHIVDTTEMIELDDTVEPDPEEEMILQDDTIVQPVCPVCGTPYVCSKCVTVTQPEPDKKFELWLDVYQGNDGHDWKLLKQNGVDGIVAKAGYGWQSPGGSGSILDSKFDSHIEGALNAGLKVAAYWWVHPLEDLKRQADLFIAKMMDYTIEFAALDYEQTTGYGKVYDKKKAKYVTQQQTISNSKISWAGEYISKLLADAGFKVVTYTRLSYIMQYAPDMLKWINKYPIWLSAMPNEKIITCSKMESLLKGFAYCETWQDWRDNHMLKPDGTFQPALPKGIDQWFMWQFSMDHVKLPGTGSYADYNWLRR